MTTFGPLFVPPDLLDAVSGRAWLEGMLEAERALATAEAAAGVIPADAAVAITEQCDPDLYDFDELLERGHAVGNPAEPLVRALRETVGSDAAVYVHHGATSQDVMDTAAMLVARGALDLVLADVAAVESRLAELAEAHRSTPMVARTILQHALPTTFGFKVAGWLVALHQARERLVIVRDERLAAELGGAAGTLAALGDDGPEVLRLYADELELGEPVLPWHTNRTRIAELGAALDTCAGVLAKIGLDLALMAQTEVAEVHEGGTGGSSTLPQKRNPIRSTHARACAELVHGYASVLARAVVQEHERAAGAWHAEWEALSGALAYAGGAAAAIGEALAGLEVDEERMRRNLELTNGLILSERIASAVGGEGAHDIVREAALASVAAGRSFEDELRASDGVSLSDEQLAEALDPATYIGSAEALVDRALAEYRRAGAESS
jgi:3-carboxy-cis,cis-muconate cycloisomerase